MDKRNLIMLFGIGLILGFSGLYYIFKAPIYFFNITLGALALVYGFCTEDNKIKVVSLSYYVASFSVNIIQWLLVICMFYYSPIHRNEQFYMALIIAILTTYFLVNRLYKEYLKNHENTEETPRLLKDIKKLTLLGTGLIIMIGCLAGFIAYHLFTLLYLATFGLTAFVYGYYHENGKINVTVKYVGAMVVTILLQWVVLICFVHQMKHEVSVQPLAIFLTISFDIVLLFLLQFYQSDLTLSDLILD